MGDEETEDATVLVARRDAPPVSMEQGAMRTKGLETEYLFVSKKEKSQLPF
jgi:hypothetical protein